MVSKIYSKKNSLSKRFRRKINFRSPKDRILIVCEGSKTEPNYFKSFPIPKQLLHVKGVGKNTLTLVEDAVRLRDTIGSEYHQVWCVMDIDSHGSDNVNKAIELAKNEKINVAYTNEAFELWYLLHFDLHTSALHRSQYKTKLNKHLDSKYKKNDSNMYEKLISLQPQAIKYAEILMKTYVTKNPSKDNPSTTIHLLVKELKKITKK